MKLLKRLSFFCFLLFTAASSMAQDVSGYQLPPKVISDLLLAPLPPTVQVDGKMKYMVQFQRSQYPTVEELGQPEAKIAGLRINPNNFSPTRQNYIKSISVENIGTHSKLAIKGLPSNLSALNPTWNPAESKIAFFQVEATRVDVYVIDIAASSCKKINSLPANLVLGSSLFWQNDNTLWYKVTVNTAAQLAKKPITPKGPTIQENLGKVSPSVTYQDMIKSPYDEYLFGFFATTQLVSNTNGVETKIGKPSIYSTYSLSPDKKYLLTRTLNVPFSYLVPAYSFASTVSVYDVKGNLVKELAQLPSGETTPSGYDNTQNAPRSFDWKDDEAAVITYAMPLDSGLIRKKLPFHDAVYALAAPFAGQAKELFKTVSRYSTTTWGNDRVALVSEQLRSNQTYRISIYNASTNTLSTLIEGNSTDLYNYPGQPITQKNAFGQQVIALTADGQSILMNNITGSSPKGDLPYISSVNLSTKQSKILWRCAEDRFEYVSDVLDTKAGLILTRSETEKQAPNYFVKNINNPSYQLQLTKFVNPYPALEGVSKEKIKYKRKDGVELTGDLYLPKGYSKDKDGLLPVLLWAYPREFSNASDASQVRGNAHKFTTLSWGSPVFYVTQGYAILDNAEMPIVATSPDKKPNDDFVNQLQLNAIAAIDKLAEMGVGDRKRIAVGGHSYGAFMTANLLAHTNLFKAGIARSGAYNRTLTPFGFQNEERTFWQAPQLYLAMSPFAFADKIKTPILLTHGEMDDNTGTYPINSERLYAALKGHGATVRFVYFPYEAHGYKGKENLLHLLWEQGQWLNKYVK
ncbi:MAG: prolyl oligopeptidase family serine peptidase [Chitinophagaceae bacterium]|nr:prolyl oligopeptidase family serine peptidase [Chitinophagaceae bacterium]